MRIYGVILLLISITVFSSCSSHLHIEGEFLGDVKLKIDNEWLMDNNGTKFIRLGISKNTWKYYPKIEHDDEFNKKAPYTNALVTSDKVLKYEIYPEYEYHITSYDIPVDANSLTIDFNFIINKLMRDEDWIRTDCKFQRGVFFYHPNIKKWWGFYHDDLSNHFEIVLYDELYKATNTRQDIEKLLEDSNRETRCDSVMENPIFNLPSMKYYEETLGEILDGYHFFCWFVE